MKGIVSEMSEDKIISTSPFNIISRVSNKLNLGKGALVEMLSKEALTKLGFNINSHFIYESGCDATGNLADISIAVECLNWYGGYIYPERWASITGNLTESQALYKFCVFFGVKPTEAQYKEAKQLGITVIHRLKQMDIYEEDKLSLVNWLVRQFNLYMGVITINIVKSVRLLFRCKFKMVLVAFCNLKTGFKGKLCHGMAFQDLYSRKSLERRLVKNNNFSCMKKFYLNIRDKGNFSHTKNYAYIRDKFYHAMLKLYLYFIGNWARCLKNKIKGVSYVEYN